MSAPIKATREVRRRVFDLKRDGKSLRETSAVLKADGVELSYRAVSDVLKGPEPGPEGADTAKGVGAGGAGVPVQGGVVVASAGGEEPITEPPADASPHARDLYAQLRGAQQRMREIPRDDEKSYASAYASILRAFTALLEKYHAALPRPPLDPSKDPHTIAARAMILQRVTSTIEAVKERARKAGYRFPGDP